MRTFVIPKKLLLVLVYALPILVVAVSVLMGGYALAQGMQDFTGARVFLGIALGMLTLFVIALLLLVMSLGINAVAEEPNRHGRQGNSDREND